MAKEKRAGALGESSSLGLTFGLAFSLPIGEIWWAGKIADETRGRAVQVDTAPASEPPRLTMMERGGNLIALG